MCGDEIHFYKPGYAGDARRLQPLPSYPAHGRIWRFRSHRRMSHPEAFTMHQSLSFETLGFEGVESADQVNRITTALMMLDGVDSVEVGRHGADVEGTASREVLIRAVKALELPIVIR
jgi:copper chaperone CopZ